MKLLAFLWLISPLHASSFFGDHARGWHWYETLPIPETEKPEKKDKDKDKKPSPQASAPKTATQVVADYRKELEDRLHTAWVNPTLDNVRAYQVMQKDMMDRSELFASRWMQNVFQHAALDHTLVSPVNQQARHIHLDLEKKRTSAVIKDLSQQYGLFFFFSSDCPYCHQFAPIVKRFAQLYDWEVIAISADGGALAEFPDAERDNGLFHMWGIQALPALFAVNPSTQEAIPIAHGLTSLDEMENRIMTLVSPTRVSETLVSPTLGGEKK